MATRDPDLLLVWTAMFPDDILRSFAGPRCPRSAAFDAYVRLHQATWAAADPTDSDAVRLVVERVGELADALPPEQSRESRRWTRAAPGQPARPDHERGESREHTAGHHAIADSPALARRVSDAPASRRWLTTPGPRLSCGGAVGASLGRELHLLTSRSHT
jgi:hypothetical protein